MKLKNLILVMILPLMNITSCISTKTINTTAPFRYLALGDSYTIGQSVCKACSFPAQIQSQLQANNPHNTYIIDIIAQTGWTTTNLLDAIDDHNPDSNYDLVTLLIGVNNQFQNKDFNIYQQEFPALVHKAIAFAKAKKTNLIVLSIPDYAYTPYGLQKGKTKRITEEINRYNAFAKAYCTAHNIHFITITDITRQGLTNPKLVTTDGLHPSKKAYSLIADRILVQLQGINKNQTKRP